MSDLLSEAALATLARTLRTGAKTPADALDEFRGRFDRVEPTVQAFVPEEGRWDRLDRSVATLEDRFPEKHTRPPLYGVPVGVKDIFHVEGLDTRAGSAVPPRALGGPEAAAVSALREAGALVLGKTVTAEFAYFDPGPTRNPHAPDHTPGGSSSGSAAAVAAGLCPLALGTQTIGSINRPAAFCGVVGVTPTYGRIPTAGVLPAAPSVDHVGYFTQDVAGARIAAGVLYEDWRAGTEPPPLETLGVVDGPYLDQARPAGRDHFRRQVDRLEEADFEIRRLDLPANVEAVNDRHQRLVAAEMALSHSSLYPEYGDRYADATSELIEEGHAVSVGDLASARAGRKRLRDAVEDCMDDRDLDVILGPSAPGPAPAGIDSTGDPVMNLPWTHAGLPTLTVPASTAADGRPLGLQCVARWGADERLLSWAESISASGVGLRESRH